MRKRRKGGEEEEEEDDDDDDDDVNRRSARRRKKKRRDSEMRDVRRDGLIEAFLIAFTPLHGLLYPRGIQYQSSAADPHHIWPWLLLLPLLLLPFSFTLVLLSLCSRLLAFASLVSPATFSFFFFFTSTVRVIPCVYYAHCANFLVNVDAQHEKGNKREREEG